MTKFEAAQPRTIFFEAGRTAFRMFVHAGDNPYPRNHQANDAWSKGYRVARDAHDRATVRKPKFTKGKTRSQNHPRAK